MGPLLGSTSGMTRYCGCLDVTPKSIFIHLIEKIDMEQYHLYYAMMNITFKVLPRGSDHQEIQFGLF